MKRFVVEVRVRVEAEAETPDEALRAVIPLLGRDLEGHDIGYSVRESREATSLRTVAASESSSDVHGLDKPLYTVVEAAQILHVSKTAMYEHANTQAIQTIRLGTRIRIPRKALVAVLDGEVSLSKPAPAITPAPRRYEPRPLPQTVRNTRKRRREEAPKQGNNNLLSVTDAAIALKTSPTAVRRLLDERKIYYVTMANKRMIPKRALEIFGEGRPPIDVVEENIKFCRAKYGVEDETERIERELREAWS